MRSVLVETVGESYEAELAVLALSRAAGVGRGRHRGAGVGRPERRSPCSRTAASMSTLEVVAGRRPPPANHTPGCAALGSRRGSPVIAWLLVPAAVAASLSGVRWLRVAQREHYLAGSATRFAIRWWRVPPANPVLLVIGMAAGIAGFWWPAAGIGAMLAGGDRPVGPRACAAGPRLCGGPLGCAVWPH